VLFRNLILIFQPLYNVVFKIFFFAVFGVIILQAMSSAGFSSDDITFAVPDQSGTPYSITIGGMARKLDILNDPSKVGNDI